MATFPDHNAFEFISMKEQESRHQSSQFPPSTQFSTQPPIMEPSAHYAVVTRDLVQKFGQKTAVSSLNLAVRAGEFFGFLGPNGAGKSTTIKMLTGLLRPTAGYAYVGGIDVWREPIRARALMGVLPEYLNLYERLSGREFITFAGHMYGVSAADTTRRCDELLQVLDLTADADKLVVDYSVGMRKKVALAAAIIHRPQVLFLDEPFEGIDPVSSRVVRDILRDLTQSGTTIFFSSHIMEVVERLCTRVGIINQGVLVAEGSLQELRERARGVGEQGKDATLEDIFLNVIGVRNENHNLSWLE